MPSAVTQPIFNPNQVQDVPVPVPNYAQNNSYHSPNVPPQFNYGNQMPDNGAVIQRQDPTIKVGAIFSVFQSFTVAMNTFHTDKLSEVLKCIVWMAPSVAPANGACITWRYLDLFLCVKTLHYKYNEMLVTCVERWFVTFKGAGTTARACKSSNSFRIPAYARSF